MRKTFLFLLLLIPSLTHAQGAVSGAGSFGCSGVTISGTAATSATANNTVLYTAVNIPAYAVKVQLDQTSTITGGAITFQQSDDGGANYISVPTAQVLNESTGQQLTNPYTLVASTNQPFLILLNGNSSFQVKLTTAISGTATVTPYVTLICQSPTAVQQLTFDANNNAKVVVNAALPAGSNIIGKVGIDQTTPGTTNAVSATNFPSTVDTNTGNASASTIRTVIATNQPNLTTPLNIQGNAADGSALSGNPVPMAGKGSGDNRIPIVCDNWTPFSLASTTSLKLVSKVSAKQVYICSINIVSASANNVALIEGTKTTTDCDTSTAGMAGGTTAATGWNFAANSGLTQGTGIGVVAATATANHDVCLLASGSGQVSGVISWTQF